MVHSSLRKLHDLGDGNMAQMEGKTTLVTGAASGIGRASALALARAGAAVCVSDINGAGAEETARRIIANGGQAISVPCDVTKADDVSPMVAAAMDAFGRLDAAVNNAGIAGSFEHRLHEADDAMFEQVLAVNLRGVWHCLKAELNVMLPQGMAPSSTSPRSPGSSARLKRPPIPPANMPSSASPNRPPSITPSAASASTPSAPLTPTPPWRKARSKATR